MNQIQQICTMYYQTTYASPIGLITLGSDGDHLVGLWIEGQKHFAASVPQAMIRRDDLPVLIAAKAWLDRYFAGEQPEISVLPLAPLGSAFRQAVWKHLMEIPYGKVTTYGEIARRVAAETGRSSMSAQAVGGAVGHNPISIIIPCHRVVGSDGHLTGYAGGMEAKIFLLRHEGVDIANDFASKKG